MKDYNSTLLDNIHQNSIFKKIQLTSLGFKLIWAGLELLDFAYQCDNSNQLREHFGNLNEDSNPSQLIEKAKRENIIIEGDALELQTLYETFFNMLINNKEKEKLGHDFSEETARSEVGEPKKIKIGEKFASIKDFNEIVSKALSNEKKYSDKLPNLEPKIGRG